MEDAAKVLDRLERIRQLSVSSVPPQLLLGELRALVAEAEAWARVEGDERARAAVAELDGATARVPLSGRGEVGAGAS